MTVSMTTRAAAASSISRADWRVAMGAPALYLLLLVGLAQALALLLLATAAVARCGAQSMAVYGSLALLLAQLGAGLLTFRWLRQRSAQARLGGASGFGPVPGARGWLLAGEAGGLLLALGAAGLAWLLPIAALGGFAAWLRVRSGSLWPGIVAHVCFNALVGFGALH